MYVPTCILLATTSTVPSVVCVTHRPKLSSQVTCGVSRHAASLPSLPRACLARHSGTTAFTSPSSTREKSGGRRGQSQKDAASWKSATSVTPVARVGASYLGADKSQPPQVHLQAFGTSGSLENRCPRSLQIWRSRAGVHNREWLLQGV